mmetsp:Transcript_8432/g.37264  ORF Transcript_8432/g.37264 Transcript_8432/m.37264 type:complete len:220 (-) Transcript_8432:670-1329(-)
MLITFQTRYTTLTASAAYIAFCTLSHLVPSKEWYIHLLHAGSLDSSWAPRSSFSSSSSISRTLGSPRSMPISLALAFISSSFRALARLPSSFTTRGLSKSTPIALHLALSSSSGMFWSALSAGSTSPSETPPLVPAPADAAALSSSSRAYRPSLFRDPNTAPYAALSLAVCAACAAPYVRIASLTARSFGASAFARARSLTASSREAESSSSARASALT